MKYVVQQNFSLYAKQYTIGQELEEENISLPVLEGLIHVGKVKVIETTMHVPSNNAAHPMHASDIHFGPIHTIEEEKKDDNK